MKARYLTAWQWKLLIDWNLSWGVSQNTYNRGGTSQHGRLTTRAASQESQAELDCLPYPSFGSHTGSHLPHSVCQGSYTGLPHPISRGNRLHLLIEEQQVSGTMSRTGNVASFLNQSGTAYQVSLLESADASGKRQGDLQY